MRTAHFGLVVLAAVAMLSTGAGCRRGGRVFVAKPAVGSGIRVDVVSPAKLKGDSFTVGLVATNDTDWKIEINRNQIALVAPDGRDFYREGGREIHWLDPHAKHPINLDIRVDGDALEGAAGVYLRFDGFYAGSTRIDVPPMPLGAPAHSPGKANRAFASTSKGTPAAAAPAATTSSSAQSDKQPGVFRRMWNAARGTSDGGSTASAEAQPAPDKTVQQYNGPRRQIQAMGTKCAAMPFKTKDVAAQMAFVLDELLLSELQQSGFEAIGPDDINSLIGFEKTKQAVGCDEMTCMSEIGNALGVQYLAAGNVAVLEGSVVLTLKLIDTRGPKVVARVNKVGEGGQKGMPRLIAEAVQDLVARSGL